MKAESLPIATRAQWRAWLTENHARAAGAWVVYYKQSMNESAQKKVKASTRELIDQVLSVGGRYYLPYQIHATSDQFKAAYPGYEKFFAVKKRVDPSHKFRNRLWDAYFPSGH